MIEGLKEYIKSHKTIIPKFLKSEWKEYLFKTYSDSESINECIYRFKHNIINRPICKTCGGYVKFNGSGYNEHCSIICTNKDPLLQKKREEKSIRKYGTKNHNNLNKSKKNQRKRV